MEWFRDGERIEAAMWPRHFVTGRNNKFLRIRRVDPGDEGRYRCKGVNGFGSKIFEFEVEVRGRFDSSGGGGKMRPKIYLMVFCNPKLPP